jgi:hypothetical protein
MCSKADADRASVLLAPAVLRPIEHCLGNSDTLLEFYATAAASLIGKLESSTTAHHKTFASALWQMLEAAFARAMKVHAPVDVDTASIMFVDAQFLVAISSTLKNRRSATG